MRKLIVSLCMLLLLSGCKRQPVASSEVGEQPPELLSVIEMSNPMGAPQLTHGFHAVENGWRWTESKFGVTLGSPGGAAKLELKLSIPAAVIARTGPLTLSASVNGQALPPETFAQPGDHVYTREVSAGPGPAVVEFSTDKALPPSGDDVRELAVIVTRVGWAR